MNRWLACSRPGLLRPAHYFALREGIWAFGALVLATSQRAEESACSCAVLSDSIGRSRHAVGLDVLRMQRHGYVEPIGSGLFRLLNRAVGTAFGRERKVHYYKRDGTMTRSHHRWVDRASGAVEWRGIQWRVRQPTPLAISPYGVWIFSPDDDERDMDTYLDALYCWIEANQPRRRPIRPRDRWAVLERAGHRCEGCGRTPQEGAVLEVDHIIPIAKGGSDEIGNYQCLCRLCNAGKATRLPTTNEG